MVLYWQSLMQKGAKKVVLLKIVFTHANNNLYDHETPDKQLHQDSHVRRKIIELKVTTVITITW